MYNKNDTTYRDPLEDKGWAQMKALLDKEMPNRKRRVAWWYWAGAAAVVAIVGFVGYTQTHPQPMAITQSDTNSSLEGGSLSPGSLEKDQMLLEEKDRVSEQPQQSVSTAESVLPMNKNSEADKLENNPKIPANKFSINAEKLTGRNAEKEIGLTASEANLPELPKMPTARDQRMVTENASASPESKNRSGQQQPVTDEKMKIGADQDKRDLFNLPFIANSDISLSYITMISLSQKVLMPIYDQFNSPVEVVDKKRFSVSLETALISETQLTKWSFDVGAGVRYAFNDVLALGSGAHFWKINKTQQFAGRQSDPGSFNMIADPSLILEPELMDAVTTPGNNVRMLAVANVDNLSYLRIPLFVQFFPRGRLQPRVGVNQLFLVSDDLSGAILERQNSVATPGTQSEMLGDIVRQKNLSYELGITYQPKDHLYLDVSYQHGQASYLNYQVTDKAVHEYHRSLRLAAGFRF